ARGAHPARTRRRPVPERGWDRALCLYDVGACDLVVPALLVRVERGPDDADEDGRARDNETDVAQERANEVELRAVRLDDLDLQCAHPKGLALSVRGPEVHEVDDAEERLESARRRRVTAVEDAGENAVHDREADEVDEHREEASPPPCLVGGH